MVKLFRLITNSIVFLQAVRIVSGFTLDVRHYPKLRRQYFTKTLQNFKEQIIQKATCFPTQSSRSRTFINYIPSTTTTSTTLFGGIGTTANYTWKEDQFDIEIRIPVPAETKTKHVSYKAKSKSMELSIQIEPDEEEKIFLHGERQFRGMIDLDGTFWSLLDVEKSALEEENNDKSTGREIVVSIEKLIVPPNDPFAVIDYDWGSVYMNDDDEILSKKYDEAEELDIREYASSLGVDIDNINMTMVDKNMFSSGLNLTRSTLDELTGSGYVKEVTRQSDGMEFIEEGSGGDKKAVTFNSLGQKIGADELEDAGISNDSSERSPIPFVDTDSPWRKTMPVEEARIEGVSSQNDGHHEKSNENEDENNSSKSEDPIDKLTVSKLKEILKKEGLKVSGNKKELQDRLKDHVSSIMEKKKLERKSLDDNA